MSIVWGKPIKYIYSTFYPVDVYTWQQCLQNCYKADNCVLVYNRGDQVDDSEYGGCEVFDYSSLTMVEKRNFPDASGAKVAFKVILDNSSSCPMESNVPLFQESSIEIELENKAAPYAKPAYTITFNETYWFIDYKSNKYCTDSSYLSVRSTGSVCTHHTTTRVTSLGNRTVSKANCEFDGSNITGIDSEIEYQRTIQLYKTMAADTNIKEYLMLLDGIRKLECQVENWATLSQCNSFNAFEFSDPYHSNNDQYRWEDGAPYGQNCLAMRIRSDSDPSRVGKVADVNCTAECTEAACLAIVRCYRLPVNK